VGENCHWQFARKRSDASYACNSELSGSLKVTEPHYSPQNILDTVGVFFICYSEDMKKVIINADDFGYSYGINKGIIEAHKNGVVTSTSVMILGIAAKEAAALRQENPNLSVGLHLMLEDPDQAERALSEQVHLFHAIVGTMPDHIDVHKILYRSAGLDAVLKDYSKSHGIPVRQLGFAEFIGSYGPEGENPEDLSVDRFKEALDQVTNGYNEIMCHPGHCDEYLLQHSSYNTPREAELKTLCDPRLKEYITQNDIELVNWRSIEV